MSKTILSLLFLLTSAVALADPATTDNGSNRLTGEAIISNGDHGTGAEGVVEGNGTTGGRNPGYYSYLFSAGWTGARPLAKMDYTFGNSHTRHTMVRGEITTHNARLDLLGADHVAHLSDSSELRFYMGFYGAQYNWAMGGDGAWRVLPLSVSFEQRLGHRATLKAEAGHSWLMTMSPDPGPHSRPIKTGQGGYFPNDDFEASLKGFVNLTRSFALTAGAVVEDTHLMQIKNAQSAQPDFDYSKEKGVTATVGATVAW
jgi:hypothetical protein